MEVEMKVERITEKMNELNVYTNNSLDFNTNTNINIETELNELNNLLENTSLSGICINKQFIDYEKIRIKNWNMYNKLREFNMHIASRKFSYTYGTLVDIRKNIEEQFSYFKFYERLNLSAFDRKLLHQLKELINKFLKKDLMIYYENIYDFIQDAIIICLPIHTFLNDLKYNYK